MNRNQSLSWLGTAALGAAGMYLMDPTAGSRRRAMLRDKAVHYTRLTRDGSDALARDLKQSSWSPTTRIAAVLGGLGLLAYATRSRSMA